MNDAPTTANDRAVLKVAWRLLLRAIRGLNRSAHVADKRYGTTRRKFMPGQVTQPDRIVCRSPEMEKRKKLAEINVIIVTDW